MFNRDSKQHFGQVIGTYDFKTSVVCERLIFTLGENTTKA